MRVDLSLGVGISLGLVPGVGVGPVARVTARRGGLSAGLEAQAALSPGGLSFAQGEAGAQLWRGTAFVCAGVGRFALCALGSGGAFAAQGEGLAVSRAGVAPWASVGARASVEVGLGSPWFLRGAVDVEVPLTRPSITVDGVRQWEASSVAVTAGLTAGATIP